MVYRFHGFELDIDAFELRHGDAVVRVEPQVLSVLACLVEQRDRLVSRDELLDRVWGHRFVSDATVASRIKAARRAVGDDGASQRLIRTVTGRGYRFVAPVEVAGRAGAVQGLPGSAHVVGRDAELAELRSALDAAAGGRGLVIFVEGPPGAGKSALVEAFLADLGPSVTALRGHCRRVESGAEAFGPFLDALAAAADGAGGFERLARVAPGWVAQLPAALDVETQEELARRALGTTGGRLTRELVAVLALLAPERPVVLVLEDLQWADEASLALVDALSRHAAPRGVLVVVTLRTTGRSTGAAGAFALSAELVARGDARALALEPLTADDVAQLLRARLHVSDVPGWMPELLVERTGGNALFVCCLVDAWVEAGRLSGIDGRIVAADRAALTSDVPESARRLVAARLDEHPARDREAIDVAAVAGTTFSAVEVAAGLGCDLVDADDRLARLAAQGSLILGRGDVRWPDGTRCGAYGFVHELHRDVAYEALSTARRATLHAAVGARLEEAHGADAERYHATRLASHFLEAGDDEKAVRYLRAAVAQSLALSAHAEAASQARQGLELLDRLSRPDPVLEIGLRSALATATIALRGWGDPEIDEEYARACDLAAGGALDELPPLLYSLATVHEYRGEYAQSEALMGRHLAGASDTLVPEALELLACSTFHQGGFERSLAFAERALAEHDPSLTSAYLARYGESPAVNYRCWAALASWYLGRDDDALAHLDRALRAARSHAYSETTALTQAAFLHQHRGDAAATRDWAEKAIEVATEQGFPFRVAQATILRGWALSADGDAVAGAAELDRGLDLFRATGAGMDLPYYLALSAETLARRGDEDAARERVGEARASLPERGFFYEAPLLRLEALLVGRRDAAEVVALLEQALTVARDQGAAALLPGLETLLGLARSGTPAAFVQTAVA